MVTAAAVPEKTIQQRFEETREALRLSEIRTNELRKALSDTEAFLGSLRGYREQAVRDGDTLAIDAAEAQIKRVEREAERQRILEREAEAERQTIAQKIAPLLEALSQEAVAKQIAELKGKAEQIAATFNEDVWQRGHVLLADFYDVLESLHTAGAHGVADQVQQQLIPVGVGLIAQRWLVRRGHNMRWIMHAARPPKS